MNNAKRSGAISKTRRLISVLEKCNGKTKIGSDDALISPTAAKILAVICIILLIGALGAIAFFAEPFVAPLISLQSFAQTLMMIMLLMSFVLSVKNIVTVLYTADDISVLMPMPFSVGQIVVAKLAISAKFPVGLSLVLINSTCIGMGLRAGMGAAFYIGTLLSSVLVPVTGLAVATLLIVIVFRVFGFIRNRDITMVLGGIFTLALTIAYVFFSNRLSNDDSSQLTATFSAMSSVSNGFPNISFMSRFMFEGFVPGLFISLAISAAVVAAALLAIKLFYLYTALSMQTTGTNSRAVTKSSVDKRKKSGLLRALTTYESRNARRNPAYLIYGFAMSFIWPLFFVLPFIFGNQSFSSDIKQVHFDTGEAMLCAFSLGIAASCFACGFNILPVTAFSREGSSFSALKSMPIGFDDYYKSKRNFSMLLCSLGSVLYILILGAICVALGIIDVANLWIVLFGAAVCFMCNLIIINCMLLKNSKKPYLNWDSETEISRKMTWVNIAAMIVGFIQFIALMVFIMMSIFSGSDKTAFDLGSFTPAIVTVCAVLAAIIFAAAIVLNRFAVKKAGKNLEEFE